MPTAPVVVDPDVYVSAGGSFLQVNANLCDVVAAAATAAGAGGGMAGTDSGGVAWAAGYDTAAARALTTGAALADAVGRLGELLDRSGSNHADADTSSVPGGPPLYSGGGGANGAMSVIPAVPPSANGTDDDPPSGWFLVAHLLEYTWPNGHQDRLRAVAAGWHDAATGLTAAADRLSGPIGDISALQSPEVSGAVDTCCQVQRSARSLSELCTALAGTCSEYADHLHDAHTQVIAELVAFAAESVAIQLVAALTAVPTGGTSEVVGQTAQVARTGLAASRIAGFLATLAGLVAKLTETVGGIALHVYQVHTQLQVVLDKGATEVAAVAAAVAGAVPQVDLDAQERAGGHTIDRHVGKSDTYLQGRTNKSTYASTFTDILTATTATSLNVAAHRAEIDAWLTSGSQEDLRFQLPLPGVSGTVWSKKTQTFLVPASVITVLRRTPTGYVILSSFPGR